MLFQLFIKKFVRILRKKIEKNEIYLIPIIKPRPRQKYLNFENKTRIFWDRVKNKFDDYKIILINNNIN